MPTNRNNNELGKAFAVGTKIEYNGKSYEDDKYNEMTIRLGIKTAIQRHLRFASLHHNSNVNIERDFKV